MAQTRTCDICETVEDQRLYAPGWGSYQGTDPLGQHAAKDLCPRCSAITQVMLAELRRKLAPIAAEAGRAPSPVTGAQPDPESARGALDLARRRT